MLQDVRCRCAIAGGLRRRHHAIKLHKPAYTTLKRHTVPRKLLHLNYTKSTTEETC
jgi:hypothetical protein